MKRLLLLVAVLLLISGCSSPFSDSDKPVIDNKEPIIDSDEPVSDGDEPVSDNTDAPVTDVVQPDDTDVPDDTVVADVPLTEDEITWFNEQFFNTGENLFSNLFLLSVYETPEDIDLGEVFYNCIVSLTDDERSQLAALDFMLEVDVSKADTALINEILLRYTGLTIDQTNKVGLDHWTYLPDYDAYYHAHGDTNIDIITIVSGVRSSDGTVKLRYYDKEVTLIPNGDSYFFVSNAIVNP